jgi:molybdenum cofactor cytidylyltransferase
MGKPKLLLPWREGRVIEAQLAAWRSGGVEAIVVVVHPDDAELAKVCRRSGAEVVIPSIAPPTMKESVLAGVEYLAARYKPRGDDVWMLAPADMPLLKSNLIDLLLAEYDPRQPKIIVPQCQGKRGHPVVFPWRLVAEAQALAADEGLNVLLERHDVRQVAVSDEGALMDIDTPEEYDRLVNANASRQAGPGG